MSRKRLIITAIVLVLILVIGGILAYFTDSETKTNKFKLGDVNIEVTEEDWPGEGDTPVGIEPNMEVAKNPVIKNLGDGDIYAFAEVTVPYDTVIVGDATAAAETQLFSYTLNTGWVELGTASKDTTNKTYTHVYAYATSGKLTALAKNDATAAVFDTVKFADVKEENYSDAGIQGKEYDVVVKGYGIQTEGLGLADEVKDAPASVWPLVKTEQKK